ncbi:PhoH family protein [Natranaerobius thermophilus JW/NM-WN-LF]|uniref:PhoH-like protein n=2 Tax=Natranaerobius TaxID=375928 RepID=B2A1X6_NATTJ|nr:PhoH family protein [Natranaerobius thermophilus]ACB84781.1 PhoH family protein [Natranaerobius thermophilus JW/NM-WN-LF]
MDGQFDAEITKTIKMSNEEEVLNLLGKFDENLETIENCFPVTLIPKSQEIKIKGDKQNVELVEALINELSQTARDGKQISAFDINYAADLVKKGEESKIKDMFEELVFTTYRGKKIKPKTVGQKNYLKAIKNNDIVFGIGPAGTGKTFLAIAMAVASLKRQEVNRLILTRPAVEAGEKLGFLPGDLQEKVDPYLRPIYDSLFDLLGMDKVHKYMEKRIIEIAPLAYMRGRTLDDSFIILDEAQNTTSEQMKMFLTRIGLNSKAVITGDITQVDLPSGKYSGLTEVTNILHGISGLAFVYLTEKDVVRHELVQKIIMAYENHEKELELKKDTENQVTEYNGEADDGKDS